VGDFAVTFFFQANLNSYSDSNWRIDWSDLKMGRCIGRGGFGEVWTATAVMVVSIALDDDDGFV
jgi:hypothetical protein